MKRNAAVHLHAFADTARFARDLARASGHGCSEVALHRFPDGESLVRVRPGGRHAVLVRSLHRPNEKIVELVLAADALRRAGARRVTLVAPYLAYMRQDALFAVGQPISQRAVAAILADCFDAVITVEAHLHRVRTLGEVFAVPAVSIPSAPAVARWLRANAPGAVVVGPDEESEPWVRAIAAEAGTRFLVGRKKRRGDHDVRVRLPRAARGSRAVIVDDIASSGRTIADAALRLGRAGFERVEAVVVHAIFARGAIATLRASGVRRVISCDTIEHPTNRIGVAGLVAPLISTAGGTRRVPR